ncbi:MAG: hypothetical protein ABL932_24410, partial [Terricaulis sp.]
MEVLDAPVRDLTVEAPILFLEPSGRKPRLSFGYDTPACDVSEIYAPRRVLIRDGRKLHASLDVEGFALARHVSAIDFSNEAEIAGTGGDEAAALVRKATGAARVLVFDHTVRKRAPDAPRQPSTRVHVD